eukprot:1596072-Rhodomonas_salina.1
MSHVFGGRKRVTPCGCTCVRTDRASERASEMQRDRDRDRDRQADRGKEGECGGMLISVLGCVCPEQRCHSCLQVIAAQNGHSGGGGAACRSQVRRRQGDCERGCRERTRMRQLRFWRERKQASVHACTHARTHARTHACTHTRTRTQTCTSCSPGTQVSVSFSCSVAPARTASPAPALCTTHMSERT